MVKRAADLKLRRPIKERYATMAINMDSGRQGEAHRLQRQIIAFVRLHSLPQRFPVLDPASLR